MLPHVTLTLANGADLSAGGLGYEIDAPLGNDGHLDPALWREVKVRCRVRRFRPGEPNRDGRLVHRKGGFGGGTWLIDYDDRTKEEDATGCRLGGQRFFEGENVSIREDDTIRTFKVASIRRS